MAEKHRIIFFGKNSNYSRYALENAATKGDIVAIVESAPRGVQQYTRGRRMLNWSTRYRKKFGLYRWARSHNLPYFFLTRQNGNLLKEFMHRYSPDLGCIASLSQLLDKEILQIPPLGIINVHASLLPHYRGPNPWFWQYYHMEKSIGVTIHAIDEGEDTGDIIQQESLPVAPGEDANSLIERASLLGGELLAKALENLESSLEQGIAQRDLTCPCRGRHVKPNEPLIDWHRWPIQKVWHIVKGTQPWLRSLPAPPAWKRGFTWKVHDFSLETCHIQPGHLGKDENGYFVAHSEGKIRVSLEYHFFRWARYWQQKLSKMPRRILTHQ